MPSLTPPRFVFFGLLALALIVPYNVTAHTYPIPTFFSEFTTLVLYLLTALSAAWVLRGAEGKQILTAPPRAGFIALSFVLLLLVQRFALNPAQPTLIFLGIGCMLAALLVMQTGYWITRAGLFERTVEVMAWALIGGTLYALLCQVVQLAGKEALFSPFVVGYRIAVDRRPYGNLAQANHLATYLAFGLASALYLVQVGRIKVWVWALLTAVLCFGEALTVSRTPWLQTLAIVAGGLLMAYGSSRELGARYRPLAMRRRPWLLAIAVLLIYLVINSLVRELNGLLGWHLAESAADRFKDAGQISPRLALWKYGWTMFRESPWLGVGWGEFPRYQHALALQLGKVEIANNSHDIVIDLLAKTGVLGAVCVFGGLGFWLWRAASAGLAKSRLFCLTLLCVLFLHALVEYPQQYLFFLLPAAFIIGLLETESMVRIRAKPAAVAQGVFVIGGLAALYPVFTDYQRAEVLYYGQRPGEEYIAAPSTIFKPWGTYGLATLLPLNTVDITNKLAMHRQAIALLPGETVLRRYAVLLALDGNIDAAMDQVARLYVFASALKDWPSQLQQLYVMCNDQGGALNDFRAKLVARYGALSSADDEDADDDADTD